MSVKLLKDLNFAEKINSNEAITEAGKDVLKSYRAYCYSNPATCGVVNGFVMEASKLSFDTGLTSILESVNNFIKENNISWKLASACESINCNNSTYNYINKFGVAQVEKLLEMNESDVVSYIKAGSLKNIQYIPEFRQICKEVYKTNITEHQAINYSVINPVSYVLVNESAESKEYYFKVFDKTFKNSNGTISEAVCDDVKFNRINALLEKFTRNGEALELEYQGIHGDAAKFSICENKLTFTKGKINESFENAAMFNEYVNMVAKAMNINEKINFSQTAALVSEVFENIDYITTCDSVKVLSTNQGTVLAIVEGANNVNLTVFRSYNAGKSSTNFDYVVEALNNVIKLTGVDLKSMYEERINEDMKKLDPEAKEIKEQLEANKEAQVAIRRKKIAMLAEQYKNDPVKIALLSKVAKDLAILENA